MKPKDNAPAWPLDADPVRYVNRATGEIENERIYGEAGLRWCYGNPLGRLAVHRGCSGQGIGSGLLKDAVLRSLQAAELIGVRALLCHAIDDEAVAFYLKHGIVRSPLQARLLLVGLR